MFNTWLSKQALDEAGSKKQQLLLWSNIPFALVTLAHVFHESFHLDQNLYGTIVVILGYIGLNIFNALRVHASISIMERFILSVVPNLLVIALTQLGESSFDAVSQSLILFVIIQASYTFGTLGLVIAGTVSLASTVAVHLLIDLSLTQNTSFVIALATLSLIGALLKEPQSTAASSSSDTLGNFNIASFSIHRQNGELRISNPNKVASTKLALSEKAKAASFMITADQNTFESFMTSLLDNGENTSDFILVRGKKSHDAHAKLLCLGFKTQSDEVACVCIDITTLEDKYHRLNAAIHQGHTSTLVAAIIHDFRNILTTIIGTAEVLEFTLTDQQAIEQVQRIINSGDRGTEKINDLLVFDSHHKKNKGEIQASDLNKVIGETLSLLRLQLPESVALEYQLKNVLPAARIEPKFIEVILSSLISNAADAIDQGGIITVSVSSELSHDGQTTIKLSVTDDGCGIKEDDIPLVTQAFWSTKTESDAAGLGLSIVKRTVTKLGGTLEIASTLNVGTQVSISIPEKWEGISVVNADIQTTDTKDDSVSKKIQNSYKTIPTSVLLVDDNPDVLASQTLLVEAMGHKAYKATSGREGLDLYKEMKDEIKLVISDFKMPYMDGIELAHELRKVNASLPIIMLTGYGESSKLSQCKELDIALILKPCGFQKLSQTIFDVQNKYPEVFS